MNSHVLCIVLMSDCSGFYVLSFRIRSCLRQRPESKCPCKLSEIRMREREREREREKERERERDTI